MKGSGVFRWHTGAMLATGALMAAAMVGLGDLSDLALAGPESGVGSAGGQMQLPTTNRDFFQPGTQPEPDPELFEPIIAASSNCVFCHAEYLEDPSIYNEPWDGWTNSMMGQAVRDPVWRAALVIANQDSADSGEYCIRCHAPGAWLGGRSMPADGSGFVDNGFEINDFEGVQCHFCHRMVNPVLEKDSPPEDVDILADLEFPPGDKRGTGRYVVDPSDVRRGPFQDIAENEEMNPHGVPVLFSPFHSRSELCATCHDVGNPVFTRLKDGTYVVNEFDMEHPTQEPSQMFPEQVTYSEWLNSQFADGGVLFEDRRFGGNHVTGIMEECQDCHMPDQVSGGCAFWEFPPWFERQDLPRHTFSGANTWVLRAVFEQFSFDTGMTEQSVEDAIARNVEMLQAASDLQVLQLADTLKMRVINFSGHKLPTGYPEGRRAWLNIRYLDADDELLAERGAYDFESAELTEKDTKVYQAIVGIGEDVAILTGLPAGPSNHLALVNEILLDNRIPPIGFTNAAYEEFGGAPVSAIYADGQYWDDTLDTIPEGAVRAVITLYYQSMTRDYVEFLQQVNETNDEGDILFDLWEDPKVGNKAPPIDMDTVVVELGPPLVGDLNHDGVVDFVDVLFVLADWGTCLPPDLCPGDANGDGAVDFEDILLVLANWS